MNVISLNRPEFSVYFYQKEGVDVVRRWFNEQPEIAWSAFEALLAIYKSGGFHTIQACVEELGGGFLGLKVPQRVGLIPCPIFRLGPFDAETEITFLTAGSWDERKNRVRPFSATGEAEENLESLLEDKGKRRRG